MIDIPKLNNVSTGFHFVILFLFLSTSIELEGLWCMYFDGKVMFALLIFYQHLKLQGFICQVIGDKILER